DYTGRADERLQSVRTSHSEHTIAQAPYTKAAIGSIMSGLYPMAHKAVTATVPRAPPRARLSGTLNAGGPTRRHAGLRSLSGCRLCGGSGESAAPVIQRTSAAIDRGIHG